MLGGNDAWHQARIPEWMIVANIGQDRGIGGANLRYPHVLTARAPQAGITPPTYPPKTPAKRRLSATNVDHYVAVIGQPSAKN